MARRVSATPAHRLRRARKAAPQRRWSLENPRARRPSGSSSAGRFDTRARSTIREPLRNRRSSLARASANPSHCRRAARPRLPHPKNPASACAPAPQLRTRRVHSNVPSRPAPASKPAGPPAPPVSETKPAAAEFTRMFQAPKASPRVILTPIVRASAPHRNPPPRLRREFTQMFQTPSAPSAPPPPRRVSRKCYKLQSPPLRASRHDLSSPRLRRVPPFLRIRASLQPEPPPRPSPRLRRLRLRSHSNPSPPPTESASSPESSVLAISRNPPKPPHPFPYAVRRRRPRNLSRPRKLSPRARRPRKPPASTHKCSPPRLP